MKKKDIFEFFDDFIAFDDLATFIARESIRYAHQNGRVFEITKEEVYAFYGIYLFMGLVSLPAYRDYWKTKPNTLNILLTIPNSN